MADYIIVGGGIYGCTVAWQLAKRGADVLLLEANTIASGASGGLGERGVRANGRDLRELPLMRLAYDIWISLHADIGGFTGYRRLGHLDLIEREEDLARAPAQVWLQNQQGIESHLLDAAQLRELEPNLSESVIAAIYCPKDGVADHTATTRSMANAARAQGAAIQEHVSCHRLVATRAAGRQPQRGHPGRADRNPRRQAGYVAVERACRRLRRVAAWAAIADLAHAAAGHGTASRHSAADDPPHRPRPSHAGDQAAAGWTGDGLRWLARALG